jgi:hypothetical protein
MMKKPDKLYHAPLPWKAESVDLGGEAPCWRVYSSDGEEVATASRWNGKGEKEIAQLIACAPDLLEAAKVACILFEGIARHGCLKMQGQERYAWICDLISRVEGKS